jgi:hypothetical protein
MSTLELTVSPPSYLFTTEEKADLRKVLADMDKQTLITPVGGLSDLALNEEGKAGGGYRYTLGAYTQLCGLVTPGLALLTLDVCGQWRKPGADTRLYSGNLAIDTLNRHLRLRFDRKLVGLQVVRNTKTKTIDGIVGSKYRYLSNSDFFARVDRECTDQGGKFFEACLYGRQFAIRYTSQHNLQPYDIAGDQYNFGFHFANSEIGGKSVRAATLLVRCSTGDSVLCPSASGNEGRVVHSGRDFEKRLHALVGQIIQMLPSREKLEEAGRMLDSKSLKLGGADHEKQVRSLGQMLVRRKLTQQFARRIVSSAASRGRSNEDALTDALPVDQRLVLGTRTAYDLFTALIRESRKLPIDQRETAEQVAYGLLTGKVF